MSKSVFSRGPLALALCAGLLASCSSDEATYRPQPRTTTQPATHSCGGSTTYSAPPPTYSQPGSTYSAPPTYTAPPPSTPKPSGGSCGKGGKCG